MKKNVLLAQFCLSFRVLIYSLYYIYPYYINILGVRNEAHGLNSKPHNYEKYYRKCAEFKPGHNYDTPVPWKILNTILICVISSHLIHSEDRNAHFDLNANVSLYTFQCIIYGMYSLIVYDVLKWSASQFHLLCKNLTAASGFRMQQKISTDSKL